MSVLFARATLAAGLHALIAMAGQENVLCPGKPLSTLVQSIGVQLVAGKEIYVVRFAVGREKSKLSQLQSRHNCSLFLSAHPPFMPAMTLLREFFLQMI
jgi:hypothetical protein